jgi:hypothetical protein
MTRSEAYRRLHLARLHRPYTLVFGTALPIPGTLAIIYGDEVSRALENISTGLLSRALGVALLVGGILTLAGIARGRTLLEAAGLVTLAAGCVVYGLGVILGLGLSGVVAGTGFLAIGVGTLLRVITLASAARQLTDETSE